MFGISIEPEKEIVLTLAASEQADIILDAVVQAAELNDGGRGIAFVLPVNKIAGAAHFLDQVPQ